MCGRCIERRDLGGADVPDIKFLSSGANRDSADHVSAWNSIILVGGNQYDSKQDNKVTRAMFCAEYCSYMLYRS